MNVQDYRAAGYSLSSLIDQAAVTRAEKEVMDAYLIPIYPSAAEQPELEPVKSAVMSLAYLLIMQRNASATRAGAKQKQTAESMTPQIDVITSQCAASCHANIMAVRKMAGANAAAKVLDICHIYFRSSYFGV